MPWIAGMGHSRCGLIRGKRLWEEDTRAGGGSGSFPQGWLVPGSQGMLQGWTHCPRGEGEELLPNSEARAKVPLLEQEPE